MTPKTPEQRAARFLELVREKGWNQSQAARQLQITSNHVNMIFKGRATPSAPLLALLEVKAGGSSIDTRMAALIKEMSDEEVELYLTFIENVAALRRTHHVLRTLGRTK